MELITEYIVTLMNSETCNKLSTRVKYRMITLATAEVQGPECKQVTVDLQGASLHLLVQNESCRDEK